jgi:hypothetical protein
MNPTRVLRIVISLRHRHRLAPFIWFVLGADQFGVVAAEKISQFLGDAGSRFAVPTRM